MLTQLTEPIMILARVVVGIFVDVRSLESWQCGFSLFLPFCSRSTYLMGLLLVLSLFVPDSVKLSAVVNLILPRCTDFDTISDIQNRGAK